MKAVKETENKSSSKNNVAIKNMEVNTQQNNRDTDKKLVTQSHFFLPNHNKPPINIACKRNVPTPTRNFCANNRTFFM